MQGAAIGGEAPGAWVFVSEHVPQRHRALACGTLSCGLLGGILLGALVARALNAWLGEAQMLAWGWRLPFLLGGVLGAFALVLRRRLHETPVFAELRQRQALARELPLKTVLRAHRGAVLRTMLLTWLLTAAVVVAILMMPALLQARGIDRGEALTANAVAICAAMAGNLLAGVAADRFGGGPVLALWSALLAASFWLFFMHLPEPPGGLRAAYAVLGLSVGITALVPALAVSGFPPQVRFSGLSFGYNVAYALAGGLTPVLLSLAMQRSPAAPMAYIGAMGAIGVGLGLLVPWRRHSV